MLSFLHTPLMSGMNALSGVTMLIVLLLSFIGRLKRDLNLMNQKKEDLLK